MTTRLRRPSAYQPRPTTLPPGTHFRQRPHAAPPTGPDRPSERPVVTVDEPAEPPIEQPVVVDGPAEPPVEQPVVVAGPVEPPV